jgi:hypothetical protein
VGNKFALRAGYFFKKFSNQQALGKNLAGWQSKQ